MLNVLYLACKFTEHIWTQKYEFKLLTILSSRESYGETLVVAKSVKKSFLFDAPISHSGFFGTSVETVVKRFKEARAQSAAFRRFSLRKAKSKPSASSKPSDLSWRQSQKDGVAAWPRWDDEILCQFIMYWFSSNKFASGHGNPYDDPLFNLWLLVFLVNLLPLHLAVLVSQREMWIMLHSWLTHAYEHLSLNRNWAERANH